MVIHKKIVFFKEIGFTGFKPISTPIGPNHKLMRDKGVERMDKEAYHRFIKRLIYVSHTRPHTAYFVNVWRQFMNSPKKIPQCIHAYYIDFKDILRES